MSAPKKLRVTLVKSVTATKLKSLAAGRMGYGTREVGDLVVAAMG